MDANPNQIEEEPEKDNVDCKNQRPLDIAGKHRRGKKQALGD